MKYNVLLLTIFLSVLIYASVQHDDGIVGTTLLNGDGCVCHNLDPTQGVGVWIEGPTVLMQGETGNYTLFLTGGPMVEGGFNVAARFNTLGVNDTNTQIIQGELTHTHPLPFVGDTVSWTFTLTATSSEEWDTLYSDANSVNGNGIPDSGDKWNFGANFPVHILPPTPVELISFNAIADGNNVSLKWKTATETNNKGFEIERQVSNMQSPVGKWEKIGFADGNRTTTEPQSYYFIDKNIISGIYYYRLKQIDLNGSYKYLPDASGIEVKINPTHFELSQNYPNPFNPSTTIQYSLSNESRVKISVYNSIGQLVIELLNSTESAGIHKVIWNAWSFPSGIYFYKLQVLKSNGAISFESVKKMILMK
jgi:Secretion system C-terminal sorting domain